MGVATSLVWSSGRDSVGGSQVLPPEDEVHMPHCCWVLWVGLINVSLS